MSIGVFGCRWFGVNTFWEGLLAAWCLGKGRLALWDGQSSETDTLLRVEDGSFPDKGLDATGTTIHLVESNLADDLVAVVPENGSMAVSSDRG